MSFDSQWPSSSFEGLKNSDVEYQMPAGVVDQDTYVECDKPLSLVMIHGTAECGEAFVESVFRLIPIDEVKACRREINEDFKSCSSTLNDSMNDRLSKEEKEARRICKSCRIEICLHMRRSSQKNTSANSMNQTRIMNRDV